MVWRNRTAAGFTLIELLVVIAIIAILAAILFPVFVSARRKANQIACISNLKQLGTALHMYVNDYDGYWPNSGGEWGTDAYYRTIGTHFFPWFVETYVKNAKVWCCPSDRGGVTWPAGGINDEGVSLYDQCGSSYQFIPQKWQWTGSQYIRRWTGPVIPVPVDREGYPAAGSNTQWYSRIAASARQPAEFPLIADVLQWHHEQPPPGTPATDMAYARARRNVWFADGHAQSVIETEFRRLRDEVVQYSGR